MGFFDFFKKGRNSNVTKSLVENEPKVDLVNEYSNKLIELGASSEIKTIKDLKDVLYQFAVQHNMSSSQIREAEEKSLLLYKNMSDSFIDSDVPLEPEVIDAMKYLRVVDCFYKVSERKRKEYSTKKWNDTVTALLPKMSDASRSALTCMGDIFELSKVVDLESDKRRIAIANIVYNVTENHQLPLMNNSEVDMIYKNSEQLHFALTTKMLKKKTKTFGVKYQGLTFNFKIMRGLKYRSGTIFTKPLQYQQWDTDAEGDFWITNQRIGFLGTKAFSVPIGKIMSMNFEEEKLIIFKEGRQNPFIIFIPNDVAEVPIAILSELLNQ